MNVLFLLTLLTLFIFFVIVNQQLQYSNDAVEKYSFAFLSFVFLLTFAYYGFKNGTKNGIYISLFLWAFFVCSVPIPQVSLLLSFPLKQFLDVTIHMSQAIISLFAIFVLVFFNYSKLKILEKNIAWKVFQKILKNKVYSIFIISIIASIIGSYVIDTFVDLFVLKKREVLYNDDTLIYMLTAFMVFILLNVWYIHICKETKIKI